MEKTKLQVSNKDLTTNPVDTRILDFQQKSHKEAFGV